MLRTPIIAAPLAAVLAVVLLGGTAMAQSATSGPSRLNSTMSDSARSAPDYDDGDNDAPPPRDYSAHAQGPAAASQQAANADRDMFCRRDAAAHTGYTTPGDAAHDEQVRGTVGGTLGGAALGAIIGAGSGNAGAGAAIGAGAGLLAGTAIGADNARHAARDVSADYSAAYYDCMHEDGTRTAAYDRRGYGGGYDYGDYPPPPPPGYYGYGPYGSPYYGGGYGYPYGYGYGPSVSFGFGFGGGRGWGGGHGFHGHR
jgi:hypothetical protein